MKYSNFMEVEFKAISVNEGFARMCVAGFCLPLNPTLEEIGDIKTAVSEAVTNCVVHAYPSSHSGVITMRCEIEGNEIKITISMESFMDRVEVENNDLKGLKVTMYKQIGNSLLQVGNVG